MTAKEENGFDQGKKGKDKSEEDYTPPPLPNEPEAAKSFLPSVNFVQTLRRATPYVPPSTAETRSKVFSKLAAAEELHDKGSTEETSQSSPIEQEDSTVALPPQTLSEPAPEVKKPAPPVETPRIIIKPIKGPPSRLEKGPTKIILVTDVEPTAQSPPVKEFPAPQTQDASIFAENPWDAEKEQKKSPEEIRIQNPWGKAPVMKRLEVNPLAPIPAPTPAPAPVEEPAPVEKKFDWKAIKAQSDVLWNYIEQLLGWLEEMIVKADQIKRSVVIERVYTIRNKIEQHFGITFADVETEKLPNVEILRIAMEYVKYLKENFNPKYFYCPTCHHIVAFYYPVATLPCPTCGSKLEQTSPDKG